ncbi:hypothetical protein JL722_5728 [Aureococcus anophagefferens]|nr:hypothetical protein JL722_5728 [Aureococcus anophagefferens]
MMAGRADELGETGAYDEAKYETHAGEFFDGPMDGALESKYGDLFAGYDEDGEALGSPAEETVASGGTQKTLATLATARFRAMSDKELVKMVRELDGATGERGAASAADEAALVADQELTRAVQQDRLAGEAARVYRELEAAANAHPLGRSSLSKAELAALADAKRAALGADAAAQRQRATAARERDAERVAEHVAQRTERSSPPRGEGAQGQGGQGGEARGRGAQGAGDRGFGDRRRGAARAGPRGPPRRRGRGAENKRSTTARRAAVEGRTKAKRRVARSGAVTREVRAHCEDARRGARGPREAVLQLKADTDAATVELRGRNEKAAMRKQAKRDEFAREKARLEARGENPYEVFRRREVEDEARTRAAAAHAKIEAKRRAVIERIAVDDARQRKIEAHEAHAAALEKAHRDAPPQLHGGADDGETKILDHTFGTGKNSRKTEAQRRELIRDLAKLPANETVAEDLGEFGRPAAPDEAPPGEALNASQAKLAGEVAQAGAGDEAEAAKAPRKHGSELSKFERDCLARAQRRQKDRLASGAPQIIAGRTLRSAAFVAEPTRIEFKDFAVGESHHRKITLTNVSLSFNNFKVLPLGDAIVDFFDVSYVKPGRMSAGTSCVIDVTFTPQVDEDIFDELPLLAATGPFSFDNVVMGETSTFSLIIKNQGALPTKFEFFDPKTGAPAGIDDASLEDDGDDDDDARERALLDQAASVGAAALKYADGLGPIQYANGGEVAGYAEVAHVIKFAPLRAGYAREQVAIRFEGFAETIPLSIIGSSIEVPIYVAEPSSTCAAPSRQTLPKKLMLRNRGKIAFKAIARAPKEFREFFEYQPDMGFVQPGADFEMSIKFRPTPAVVDRCAPYCIKDRGIIAVPMRIMVPDQALPVYYTLRAQLTRSDVSFSTTARLRAKFGFVNLSAEVDVQPNDGFGVLLPRESRTVDVIFKPVSAVNVDLNLTMRTTMNNTYAIKPAVATVAPGETRRVEISFAPPRSKGPRDAPSLRDANVQPKARDLDAVFGHAPPPPPTTRSPSRSPTTTREAAAAAKRARDAELKAARDAAYAAATTPPEPFEGTLTTTTVERTFWCDCEKIDFGQLAVGQTSTLPLRLRNLAADGPPLEVKAVPGLNGVGPFMMVNALRPLHPKAPPHSALLQFAPTARARSEHLELVCPALGRTVRVALRGEGVSPTLELDPPDGFVDMGHVFVAPGATLAVKIKFRPDHGRVWAYYQKLRVEVPNEDKRHVLTVLGRCHDHQMYVVADDRPLSLGAAFEDPFGLPAELDDAAAEVRDMMGLGPPVNPKIAIRFPRVADRPKADDGGDGGDRSRRVRARGLLRRRRARRRAPRTEEAREPRVQRHLRGRARRRDQGRGLLGASPDKGTVPAGGTAPVAFTFTPPEAQAGNGLDVGRWIKTVAKVHLKGFPESFTYDVELEGYMPNL